MTSKITNREIAFFGIHALACRELVRDALTVDASRKAELIEIIRKCEHDFPYLANFRRETPDCSHITKIIDAITVDIS